MAKRFDLLVFDWDGTLMDSASSIVSAIKAAGRDLGVGEPSEERVRYVIGLGLAEALRHALPDLTEENYPQMVERFRHYYLARAQEVRLFAGVDTMIAELADAGYMLAVATGNSRKGLERVFQQSGLGPYFQDSRCADECHSKPHPQMLEELMAVFGVVPERILMIGDTTHDLQMAKNAGVQSLAVAYGAHPAEALDAHEPLACLYTVAELRTWLHLNA